MSGPALVSVTDGEVGPQEQVSDSTSSSRRRQLPRAVSIVSPVTMLVRTGVRLSGASRPLQAHIELEALLLLELLLGLQPPRSPGGTAGSRCAAWWLKHPAMTALLGPLSSLSSGPPCISGRKPGRRGRLCAAQGAAMPTEWEYARSMVTSVTIRRLKRFNDETFELGEAVVLAGPNNSGKTTLLQAIATWPLGLRHWLSRRSPGKTSARARGRCAHAATVHGHATPRDEPALERATDRRRGGVFWAEAAHRDHSARRRRRGMGVRTRVRVRNA